ncbi:HAMP domain-containing sensor histidine kinase [Solwaraspora sp. WMMD1047]|uniref:sensor histidine kinase n=1 Tax=Solwaraspora sp. WMMD1047 TaxID=3016102 RepID=UPI00241634A6|nr:HAMP domain-containing sensor histidine kinase [Solwaraspora sp. WMMD1047]MDG4833126.1 HAMP domain-containing sensor histidine kinase [Solwaraspora sp. WMMD1047]
MPLSGRLRSVPLRIKLVAAVLVLVAAALVVISVTTTFFLRSYLVDKVDGELSGYLNRAMKTTPSQAAGGLMPTDYVYVRGNVDLLPGTPEFDRAWDQAMPSTSLPDGLNDAEWYREHADGKAFTTNSEDRRLRWRMIIVKVADQDYIAVGQHLGDVDLAVRRLVWADILVGSAVMVTLAALGAAIVRTSLRPLVEIEQTAAAIAEGDLSRRVPDPEPSDGEARTELGRLSRALNAMLNQIEAAFTARAASEYAARSAEMAARDAAIAAQASESRARRSEERMRQFVADASHELRTPLTTIRGFAELYRQGAASRPDQVAPLLRRIEDEAARMGLLVEDLLLLARLDRERPLVLAPVELPVLATEAVEAARAVAPERDVSLDVQPGAGTLVVLGDDARLRQILGNLMTNALTHTPASASVSLRLSRGPGDRAVIEVVDTGPGLTAEQAERVFERFYRADAARTRHGTGGATSTGLGLAIVAALVAAHDGTVQFVETPGGGATFRVELPLAPPDDEAV